MKNYKKEIIKLTAKEALFSIFDLALPFFESSSIYRVSAKKLINIRENDRSNFSDKVKYLKRHGLIQTFVENKEEYIEITKSGIDKIDHLQEDMRQISRPDKWDGKWRVVLFDIPNSKKVNRDMLRMKILKLGFIKVQESIYVYPFECTKEISAICSRLDISQYVLIMVSDIIQGENQIVDRFLSTKVLNTQDISNR